MKTVDRKKVLIGIPCLLTGGTEIHTRELASTLAGAGYDVVVCCYFEYEEEMKRSLEAVGARVYRLELSRERQGKNLRRFPALAAALHALFKKEKPFFFHVQYLAPGAFPALWGKVQRVPRILATLHTPGHMYKKSTLSLAFVARRICDAFFCVSRSAERAIFGDSEPFSEAALRRGRRHFYIFNGVDTEKIERLGREADNRTLKDRFGLSDDIAVGVVGRLNPVKGHAFLLDGFAKLVDKFPAVQLLIVGEGQSRADLQRQAVARRIADKIRWAGRLAPDEALQAYSVMDIVAVPSRFEGFGLAAAEAMAAARPVVAADVDGLADLVEPEKSGLLVPYGNEAALAEALQRLAADAGLRKAMAEAGRSRVRELFDIRLFRENWLAAYRALAAD